jgi:acyl-[acyl-carrier-protein]-phospholipid O-acyltransferase/long-chain-fatty-acid--[acyl-carrier-protein] ligase
VDTKSQAAPGGGQGPAPGGVEAVDPREAGWRKGFGSLMFTQFQGAFSDNALKWLVTFLVFSANLPREEQDSIVSLAGALFAVPFLLFSMWGGWLADRCSKRTVMMGVKIAEVGIMLFAAWALSRGSLALQLAAICLMGAHSAFFAPAKYGILPEVLPPSRLSWGNGILELLTFVAIILGTVTGGFLAEAMQGRQMVSGLLLAALAVVGWGASRGIQRVPAADPAKRFVLNFPAEVWRQMGQLRRDRDLWRANWGNTGFFYVAALVQMNLALYAKQVFQLQPTQQSWLQAALCLGIGAGSACAGQLSRGRIAYGFVPIGAVVMAAAAAILGWPGISKGGFTAALALLGLGGGLFIVPVAAVLQHRPAAGDKGAVQGVASWLSWVGIIVAALTQETLGKVFHFTHAQVFWFCGVAALAAGSYVAATRPGAIRDLFRAPAPDVSH